MVTVYIMFSYLCLSPLNVTGVGITDNVPPNIDEEYAPHGHHGGGGSGGGGSGSGARGVTDDNWLGLYPLEWVAIVIMAAAVLVCLCTLDCSMEEGNNALVVSVKRKGQSVALSIYLLILIVDLINLYALSIDTLQSLRHERYEKKTVICCLVLLGRES